jgi:prevent-host-death family protein
MQEIAISEFKATCLSLLDEVNKTKKPIRILRRGKPVAEIVPPTPAPKRRKLGRMAGAVKILGDIVSPIIDLNDIEATAIETVIGHSHLDLDDGRTQSSG